MYVERHNGLEIAQASRNFDWVMEYRMLRRFVRPIDVLPDRVLFVVTGQEFYYRMQFLERNGTYTRDNCLGAEVYEYTYLKGCTGVFPGTNMGESLIRHMKYEGPTENEWWEFRIHGGPILPRLWAWVLQRPYYVSPFKVASTLVNAGILL